MIGGIAGMSIQKAIGQIKRDQLISKRYVVDEDADLQLQRFCMKYQLKPSDVLTLAISELIQKYEEEDNIEVLLSWQTIYLAMM